MRRTDAERLAALREAARVALKYDEWSLLEVVLARLDAEDAAPQPDRAAEILNAVLGDEEDGA